MHRQISPEHLKTLAIASALLWAALLVPLYPSWTAPLPDDPVMNNFARNFLITSTLKTLAFSVSGVVLSLWSWLHRSAYAALVVAFLAAGALWWAYLASSGIFFRPPMGDGTISKALHWWWRLHGSSIGLHAAKILFFLASIIIWPMVSYRLSGKMPESQT